MLKPGDVLRGYRILARIRSGGMATLYLAQRQGALGFARPVAIKVIHPHLADDPTFVRMFVDEALLASRVADPHVVHVDELVEDGGTLFLVMEYVEGASLSQLLSALGKRKRRPTPSVAVYLACEAAAGLHAAHEARADGGEPLGIVHRDVSPQNILVGARGHVKIIDFGIAQARSKARTTTIGSLRGKLAYMAPEQAFGRTLDRRADIYALGVVLWEMLTMQRLFRSDNEFALLELVRAPVVARPRALVAELPAALDAAVVRALAPNPDDRPATALELRRMLTDALPEVARLEPEDLAALLHELGAGGGHTAGVVEPAAEAPTSASRRAPVEALETLTREAPGAAYTVDGEDGDLFGAPGAPGAAAHLDATASVEDAWPSFQRRRARPWLVGAAIAAAAGVVWMAVPPARPPDGGAAMDLASPAPASTSAPPPAPDPPPPRDTRDAGEDASASAAMTPRSGRGPATAPAVAASPAAPRTSGGRRAPSPALPPAPAVIDAGGVPLVERLDPP
jgi:serine/threonine-protein kinase